MQWHHEPPAWHPENNRVTVQAGAKTDFWRVTRHAFINDNGHFYSQPFTGDFTAEVKFKGAYIAQYDHAGLMVRENERTWVKCGVEYVDGKPYVGAVITRDFSDWSIMPLLEDTPIWLRVMRIESAIEVYFSSDGSAYSMIRQGYLSESETLDVGIMCASPVGDGFDVTFEGLTVR